MINLIYNFTTIRHHTFSGIVVESQLVNIATGVRVLAEAALGDMQWTDCAPGACPQLHSGSV